MIEPKILLNSWERHCFASISTGASVENSEIDASMYMYQSLCWFCLLQENIINMLHKCIQFRAHSNRNGSVINVSDVAIYDPLLWKLKLEEYSVLYKSSAGMFKHWYKTLLSRVAFPNCLVCCQLLKEYVLYVKNGAITSIK